MAEYQQQVTQANDWLNVSGSAYLLDWLERYNVSLAFSTYQTGKLFFVGRKSLTSDPLRQPMNGANQRFGLSVFERSFTRCMGLYASPDAQTIWMSSLYQLWRFENLASRADIIDGHLKDGFDAIYVPRVGYTTANIDTHDVVVEDSGRIIFVNTLFGCLATLSEHASFQPLWKPPFLTALAPEDRCHLNGLALRDGKARYVSAVCRSNVAEGWRDHRRDGGVVLDVTTNDVLAEGLSMPHSPRWYRNRLWLLNSGRGQFGFVDLNTGRFEPIAFCPGYLRGLSFVGNYAVMTLSLPRQKSFEGLELEENLQKNQGSYTCGVHIIDLTTGHLAHWIRLESTRVTELYDVVVLQGIQRPKAVGFKNQDIEQMILVDVEGQL